MSTSSIDDLLTWLAARKVEDIVVPGYIDHTLNEERPFLNVWNTSLYVVTDEGMLRIEDRRAHGRLHLSRTDDLTDAEQDLDEHVLNREYGEEFMPVSLEWQLLADGRDFNTLTRARYAAGPDSRPQQGVVDCLELVFDDCCCLFTASEWDGLDVGSHGAFDRWTDYLHEDPEGLRRVVEWTPSHRR
ncbi:hypothetical protein O4J56_10940 [Nocardiopsis sp. RSe5-2]|uniref:Uncharacterized protein n=1 Tax=Nocardiopsis endophytica TaxID=3018445 RepID=A0ABT4U2H8_9ACTN|nr:hypothetical protein [Nocardiopsis endophytica]MDA2811153.1 hypothetical protein [Nocardiopsis endophytica]